jgi:biotin-dependent carboxylase-like uncharacterized protein
MTLTVVDAGVLTTIQDLGRPGFAHLGVPRAGALDAPAAALGNRIVGNPPSAAVLETTVAGCALRSVTGHWVAITGAPCHVTVGGHEAAFAAPVWVAAGATLVVGPATTGVRSYVAVAGGITVDPVLGSRSTDTLAWVGPPLVSAGVELPIGAPQHEPQAHDTPRPPAAGPLRLLPGPRADWFTDALGHLCATSYAVGEASNRIGLRLRGTPLNRMRDGELASEGMVLGAVQVPPDGQPVIFLADHPVTGGYPVAAVVHPDDLHRCAQLRPGEQVRFIRG